MAVNFTTNIALAKPTDAELALNWTRGTKLNEDNNLIIIDEMDIVKTTTTPTFIAATTNPSVGAGSIQLEYSKSRGFIFGEFQVIFTDPGVAPGTGVGAYGIRLPELADTTFHTVAAGLGDTPGTASCIGEGHYSDNSAIAFSGTLAFDIAHITGVAYLRPVTETYAGKTQRWIGPSIPAAVATGDRLLGNFCYKAA